MFLSDWQYVFVFIAIFHKYGRERGRERRVDGEVSKGTFSHNINNHKEGKVY
jgi:hypothetical protein